jgi:hypothetical protein
VFQACPPVPVGKGITTHEATPSAPPKRQIEPSPNASSNDDKHAEVSAKSRRDQLLAILEIEASVPLSADLVRRHYTRLMDKFAPEKVQALGSDVVAVIQRKQQEVEQAARTLIAQWNEELSPKNSELIPKDLRHNPDLDALFGA